MALYIFFQVFYKEGSKFKGAGEMAELAEGARLLSECRA